jgi:hypothetical protein
MKPKGKEEEKPNFQPTYLNAAHLPERDPSSFPLRLPELNEEKHSRYL